MTVADVGHYACAYGITSRNCWDELTHFTEDQYRYLISRCRTTKAKAAKGVRPHIIAGTNPGGVGAQWVKARFIDPAPWGTIFTSEKGQKRAFIPARLDDNPHIDEDYQDRLAELSPVEYRQLRWGDWDAWDGRFFSAWDREVHVVEPFPIPEFWPIECGLDYGYTAPWAVVWGAWAPDGDLYIVKEAYETEKTPSEQVDIFRAVNGDDKPVAIYADPSIYSRTGIGEPVAMQYSRKGLRTIPAMNARISGWAAIRDRLRVTTDAEGNKRARLYIFDTCTNLIRTMPQLPRSDRNPEDCDTRAEDHLPDALRYLCMTHGRKGRAPDAPMSDVDRILARADRHRRDRRGRQIHSVLGAIR